MQITALIIFVVIGGLAGWRTGTAIRGGGTATLPGIIGAFGAVAGGLLFWFLTRNVGGLISSIVIAVLGGVLLLYFFQESPNPIGMADAGDR